MCIQVQRDRQYWTSSNGRFQTQSSNSQSGADHPTPETHQPWHVRPRDPRSAAAGASVWQWKRTQHQLHKQVQWCLYSCERFGTSLSYSFCLCRIIRKKYQPQSVKFGTFFSPLLFFSEQWYCMHSLPVAYLWPLVSPETHAAMGSAYSSGSTCSISGILGIAKCSCKQNRGKDVCRFTVFLSTSRRVGCCIKCIEIHQKYSKFNFTDTWK